jgi:hypothetical protein
VGKNHSPNGPQKGPHVVGEAEVNFRYSALRKSDAKSGEWVVIGMILPFDLK